MRNAGDRSPGGSSGRRQRAGAPDTPARASGNGGSLFTPAYRVNRPGSASGDASPRGQAAGYGEAGYANAETGYSWGDDNAASPSGAGSYLGGDDPAGGASGWPDEPAGTLYSWADDDRAGDPWPQASLPGHRLPARSSVSNAVRGLPPDPDDPPHVYPPGPFAAWNRSGSAGAGREDGPGARRGDPTRQLAAATITPDEFDTDFSLPAIKDPTPGAAGRAAAARRGSGSAGSRAASSGGRAALPAGRSGSSGTAVRESRSGSATDRGSRTASRGGRRQATRSTGRRTGHHSVKIAIGAAVAIVVAVALVLVLTSHGNPAGNLTAPQHNSKNTHSPSASPSPSTAGGAWQYIAIRATDPAKLTDQELYPVAFTSAGLGYRRSIDAIAAGCRSALIGSSLQAAVHRAGCTQAIRASYFSRAAKMMATIGVFNLKTYAGAGTAARAAGRSEFVAQLPAHSGPTRQIGQGTGIEYAGVKGHYLVLVYAEFINLRTPTTSAQRQRLDTFISTLIAHTANISLSYRMTSGKPMPPG